MAINFWTKFANVACLTFICHTGVLKRIADCNIAMSISEDEMPIIFLHFMRKFDEIRSSNPGYYDVRNSNFFNGTAKIGI